VGSAGHAAIQPRKLARLQGLLTRWGRDSHRFGWSLTRSWRLSRGQAEVSHEIACLAQEMGIGFPSLRMESHEILALSSGYAEVPHEIAGLAHEIGRGSQSLPGEERALIS
jgi:hypothetical protein